MSNFNFSSKEKDKKTSEEEFRCTGCNTPLSIYDEKCPKCERKNPNYIYK